MKINGTAVNKVVNLYNHNKKVSEKSPVKTSKDTIEISDIGKTLSNFSIEEGFENKPEKIERLKKEIAQGTYKPDSKLVAKKMLDNIKGKGV